MSKYDGLISILVSDLGETAAGGDNLAQEVRLGIEVCLQRCKLDK